MQSKWTDRDIREVKPKLYHGHTIIELKNVKNGSRERIEHDNEFTDGISEFMTSGGYFDNSPWSNETWRSVDRWHRFVGGIFLFDSTIDKVNDKYPLFAPGTAKMTANGSYGVSNNSTPELGSFNASESVFGDTTRSYVYDWTTTQGNGTINSVCLTSDVGGYIGYGNQSDQTVTAKSFYALQGSNSFATESGSDVVVMIDNVLWRAEQTPTHTLKMSKVDCPVDNMSLFQPRGEGAKWYQALPSGFSDCNYNTVVPVPGIGFACIKCNNSSRYIPANESTTVAVCNIKTKEMTTKTLTSAGDRSLYFGTSCVLVNGNVLTNCTIGSSGSTNKIHQSMTGGSAYAEFTGSSSGTGVITLPDGTFFAQNGNGTYMARHYGGVSYPTNGTLSVGFCGGDGINMVQMSTSAKRYRNPLYLATVNNLDDEVTKTSSLTMKVTYIITREE